MNNEPVLIVMDGEYIVHCGHPDKFDKDLLALYLQDGYNVQTIPLEKFKTIDWKWVWNKNAVINTRAKWINVIPSKAALQVGDVVFHRRGYIGIVTDTNYNDEYEVQVDWFTFFSNSSDSWAKPTIASRSSTSHIMKAMRLIK